MSLERGPESGATISDAEGAWSLIGLGAGTHELRAEAPGYASQGAQVLHQVPDGISVHDFRLDRAVGLDFLVLGPGGSGFAPRILTRVCAGLPGARRGST